jgi:hypothetical protein
VVRYEDMLDDPLNAFKGALAFLNLEYGEVEIMNAINNSSFDRLRNMEEKDGFKERAIDSEMFFREGKSNQWKSQLTESQINEIISQHGNIMKRFGYLPYIKKAHEKGI